MVEGPAREGHAKVAYVLQTAVHAALAEGLGHGNFEDTELERVQLVEEKHELLSPKATNPRSLVSTNDKRAQSPKEGTSSNMRGSPSSPSAPAPISPRSPQRATPRSPTTNPPQPRRPPAPRQPRTSPEHTHRPVRPKLPADSQQEIAHHRALALAALEGRVPNVPTPGERHSDTTPTSAPRVPIPRPNPATVPSYISRQRPFGPTSASGGTTLSYGDGPRRYDGVPIAAVMETLYPENRDGKGEGRKDGEGVGLERGSYASFRSFESQRHPGPSAGSTRSRGSVGSAKSHGSGGRRRGDGESVRSFGSRESDGRRGDARSPRRGWRR
ncbi:hypothetical protein DPSP01_010319 [Paraphaeosphaeria sporulosa]